MIECDMAELLKPGRELRLCRDSGEESTEKQKAEVAKSLHVQSHIKDRRTWANVGACHAGGGRRGGLYCGETGSGSRAAAFRRRKPSSTDVCAGNVC